MKWLGDWASSSSASATARELFELVSIVDSPDAFPPSKQYTLYSDRVASKMSGLGSEEEARQLVADVYVLSLSAWVPPVVVYYPPLRECVKGYYKTPELLVTLFNDSEVVGETEGASDWLRQAHRLAPDNKYVLWQRILSRDMPWF